MIMKVSSMTCAKGGRRSARNITMMSPKKPNRNNDATASDTMDKINSKTILNLH